MNKIDMISTDPASGYVLLHLLVEGPWDSIGDRVEWIRRRLNAYGAFVVTGQLAENEKYRGFAPKILLHFEFAPPFPLLMMLTDMRQFLISESIEMGVTVGLDLKTDVALPRTD